MAPHEAGLAYKAVLIEEMDRDCLCLEVEGEVFKGANGADRMSVLDGAFVLVFSPPLPPVSVFV